MKNLPKFHNSITATIPSFMNEKAKVPISGIAPNFSTSFGLFAVVLPSAQHDLESSRTISEGERINSEGFIREVVEHLYGNLGGADFQNLVNQLESKRDNREFVYLRYMLDKLLDNHSLPQLLDSLAYRCSERHWEGAAERIREIANDYRNHPDEKKD